VTFLFANHKSKIINQKSKIGFPYPRYYLSGV
jgi:hypothetical protein